MWKRFTGQQYIANYRRFVNGKALGLKHGKWMKLSIRQKKK